MFFVVLLLRGVIFVIYLFCSGVNGDNVLVVVFGFSRVVIFGVFWVRLRIWLNVSY